MIPFFVLLLPPNSHADPRRGEGLACHGVAVAQVRVGAPRGLGAGRGLGAVHPGSGIRLGLPSGYVKIAIENAHVYEKWIKW